MDVVTAWQVEVWLEIHCSCRVGIRPWREERRVERTREVKAKEKRNSVRKISRKDVRSSLWPEIESLADFLNARNRS